LQNLSLFADDHFIPDDLATTALSRRIADYRLCRPRQNGTSKGGLCSEDLLSFPRGSSREDGGLSRKKSPSIESRVKPLLGEAWRRAGDGELTDNELYPIRLPKHASSPQEEKLENSMEFAGLSLLENH